MMVSWDIAGPAAQNFEHWNARLMEVIAPYAWIRALRTSYVVKIPSPEAHTAIARGMIDVGAATPGIQLLISPPINGGQYCGLMKDDLWDQLNGLTGDSLTGDSLAGDGGAVN